MITLPLTVLAWEGPQARTYLAAMARADLRPRRILLVVNDPRGRGVRAGRAMVKAEARQDRAQNFHPRTIRRRHGDLVARIGDAMGTLVADAAALYGEVYDTFSYDDHADDVRRVVADRLGDQALLDSLAGLGEEAVLFTGGGIVPRAALETPGIRFLHVHPGWLPAVRGADGLLWSLLVRGRAGVSCFYMEPGLDTGDVIARDEVDLAIALPETSRPDDQTLYRALFSFVDPLLRARLLISQVLTGDDPRALPSVSQDETDGVTFHFLHPELRSRSLRMLFPAA